MEIETLPVGPCNVRGGEVLRLGRRRAYRVVRWLGGHRLPPAGTETALRGGCTVCRWGSGYDVRGPRETLVRLAACLTAQERVERAAARKANGGAS